MSLVPLAAPLIRFAITDENYAIDLDVSLRADDRAREALLHAAIEPDDLRWMAPSEWRWFARWRQARGGPLDLVVLNHLERTDASRAGRFELRRLVMRDPETEDLATRAPGRPPDASVGLVWLEQQARGFEDAPELALDARRTRRIAWLRSGRGGFRVLVQTRRGRSVVRRMHSRGRVATTRSASWPIRMTPGDPSSARA
jgi:hypothetical protein